MSQAVTVDPRQGAAAFTGSAAHAVAPRRLHGIPLGVDAVGHPVQPQVRTPLSVVPARSRSRRLPLAVFLLTVLAAALGAVLMLNISVSGTQYELVQLRAEQIALNQQNEALVTEIEDREAPQNLASRATKLGMVSSPSFGTVDLDAQQVTGAPEPAVEGTEPGVLIAPPNLTGEPQPVPSGSATDGDEEAAPGESGDPDTAPADTAPAGTIADQ